MPHTPDRTKEHDKLYTRMPEHAGASMARFPSEPQTSSERILIDQKEELRTRTSMRARAYARSNWSTHYSFKIDVDAYSNSKVVVYHVPSAPTAARQRQSEQPYQ